MKKLLIGIGILFGLAIIGLFGLFMVVGLMIESGRLPDTTIVPGNKISSAARQAIDKAVTLRPNEKIQYFYSSATMSWEEDGNLITNERVVSYSKQGDIANVVESDYEDIEQLIPVFSDSWAEDSSLTVVTTLGESFVLLLSSENGLDRPAVQYVQKKVGDSQGNTEQPIDADVQAEINGDADSEPTF